MHLLNFVVNFILLPRWACVHTCMRACVMLQVFKFLMHFLIYFLPEFSCPLVSQNPIFSTCLLSEAVWLRDLPGRLCCLFAYPAGVGRNLASPLFFTLCWEGVISNWGFEELCCSLLYYLSVTVYLLEPHMTANSQPQQVAIRLLDYCH